MSAVRPYHVAVRRTVAVVLTLVVAGLAAGIFGEYEFRGALVPVGAGVGVGYAVATTLGGTARWRGPVPGTLAALLAGSSLLGAGWIDSDEGVEAYPPLAVASALVGMATAATVVGRRRPAATAESPSVTSRQSSK